MAKMEWIKANPGVAVTLTIAALGFVVAAIGFAARRHREYITFMKHVDREEREVWPALDLKITSYHDETLALFARHGERLARMEAKIPNGQLDEMQRTLDVILEKLR